MPAVDLQLGGRTAIVTGGSRGIGKAIALELAHEGVDVAIVARGLDALTATAAEIAESTGQRIVPVRVDTTDDASVHSMAGDVLGALGHVDILINAAADPGGGAEAGRTLAEATNQRFFDQMNVKVMGYLRCTRAVAPSMMERHWGRVVNIGGMAGRRSGNLVGAARNAALVAMSKNLADELGPHGINVTVVHPGQTRTERTPGVIADRARNEGISAEEVEKRMASQNSVRRFLTASDVAYVVAMLCSPRAVAINGEVIAASGGADRAIYF
jgi:NAD(P)-dependent dehydrogenase (short-subunit alcohol dehydrogenase family)